jgi:large subunit ribosomal protein L24
MSKLHIKKGDMVFVNAGDHRGSTGRVLQVFVKENRVIVEGINKVCKHTKPNAKYPQGGIEKKEAPVHISNLNVVDPKSGKPTRIGRKLNDKSNSVRYAKISGEEIK